MPNSDLASVSASRKGSTGGDIDRTVVWLRGEHGIATTVLVGTAIARAARVDDVDVMVDLSGVTVMDGSTVGVIIASRRWLRSQGQSLEVRAPSAQAMLVLELCGFTHIVHGEHVDGSAFGSGAVADPWSHNALTATVTGGGT